MKFIDLERNAEQMRRKQVALREQARARAARISAARKRAIRWSLDQLKRASGPIVYIWWGRTAHPLYVGMSEHGISRCLDRGHHNSDIRGELAQSIEFICCATVDDAVVLEAELIESLKPQYNLGNVRKAHRLKPFLKD